MTDDTPNIRPSAKELERQIQDVRNQFVATLNEALQTHGPGPTMAALTVFAGETVAKHAMVNKLCSAHALLDFQDTFRVCYEAVLASGMPNPSHETDRSLN